MLSYRERLYASPWTFVASALIIPATLLVFLPISPTWGVVLAVLLYAACVAVLVASAPLVTVTPEELRAGRAHIPRELLGAAEVFTGDDAFQERGRNLDARAWPLLRGGIRPVVKVHLDDPDDPAPYWLLSSRHPDELAGAINAHAASSSPNED